MAAAAGLAVAAGAAFFGVGVAFGAMPGISFMSACAHPALGWKTLAVRMKVVAKTVRAVEKLNFIGGSGQALGATETTRNMPISM
jgi:hypothetical protein